MKTTNYTAFVYDPSLGRKRFTNSEAWGGFRSKKAFATELRANGYRVCRIEITEIYDFVTDTNMESFQLSTLCPKFAAALDFA